VSSGSCDGIVGFNRVIGFYSLLLLRASRDGFRRGFSRRKGNNSLRNINSRRGLIGRHGCGVLRLAFRYHAKRDVGSLLRRRDSFEESWRV
jgi:hypothetical protein